MYVAGADQLVRADFFPETEIDSLVVVSDHPAEKHIQSFAGRLAFGSGNVFHGPPGEVGQANKPPAEVIKILLHRYARGNRTGYRSGHPRGNGRGKLREPGLQRHTDGLYHTAV